MWAMESLWGKKPVIQILSMVVGLIVCYAMGTIWFMVVGISLGFWSLLLAHVTFCLPYVTVTIFSRLNANIDFGLAKWGSVACQDIPSQYTFENPIDLLKLL